MAALNFTTAQHNCIGIVLVGVCTDSLLRAWPHRQQDEDLDQLGESVTRIGHLGLTIHEELNQQASICPVVPCGWRRLSAARHAEEQMQACCTLRCW